MKTSEIVGCRAQTGPLLGGPAGAGPGRKAGRAAAPLAAFQRVLGEKRPGGRRSQDEERGDPPLAGAAAAGGPPPARRDLQPAGPRPAAFASPAVARLLVGEGRGATAEARIELRAGSLAGASIHIAPGASGIELRFSAPTDGARRALADLIDRARLHLRSRGIVLRAGTVVQSQSTDRRSGVNGERPR